VAVSGCLKARLKERTQRSAGFPQGVFFRQKHGLLAWTVLIGQEDPVNQVVFRWQAAALGDNLSGIILQGARVIQEKRFFCLECVLFCRDRDR